MMFHVKQRPLAFVVCLALLSIFVIGCGRGTASSRGWAEPVQNNGQLLVSTEAGRLDAVGPIDDLDDTLVFKWRFPDFWQISDRDADNLDGIYDAPIIGSDGDLVFLGDFNGFVYAFRISEALTRQEIESGTIAPSAAYLDLNDPIIGGLILDEAAGALFVAAGDKLYAINLSNFLRRFQNPEADVGQIWTAFQAGGDIWSGIVESGDHILVASLDGNLYAINKTTGIADWTFPTDSGLVSTPKIVGDIVVVGGFGGNLHAIDLADGAQRWTFPAEDWLWSEPLSSGGVLYFGDFSGVLYAINAADGTENWRLELGKGAILAKPILADGTLVVATEEGWLLGLNPETRDQIWSQKIDASITANLRFIDGKVIIAPDDCVSRENVAGDIYYIGVDLEGNLESALDVCR